MSDQIDLGYSYDVSGALTGSGVGYSVWADPSAWQYSAGGMMHLAAQSSSGVSVTPMSMLYSAAFWQGINTLSGDCGQIELRLIKDSDQDGASVVRNHPGAKLLRRPHRYLRAGDFRELMMARAIIYGNACAKIIRDAAGRPTELLPLPPEDTSISYDERGNLWYHTEINDEDVALQPEDVFHITSLSNNGLWGLPLSVTAKDVLGDELGLQTFALKSFANGATPGGYIKVPGKMTPEARRDLKTDWQHVHGGIANAGSIGVLDSGKEFIQANSDHASAQLIEARKFAVDQVARILGIPAFKVGSYDGATFSNVEEMQRQYLTSFSRWLNKWEQEADAKLLTDKEFDKGELGFRWDTTRLIQSDSKTRAEVEGLDIVNRVRSPNEVRRARGLAPYEGGDEFVNPYTTSSKVDPSNSHVTDDGTGQSTEESGQEPEGEQNDVAARLMIYNINKTLKKEVNQVRHAAQRSKGESEFVAALGDIFGEENELHILVEDADSYCSKRMIELTALYQEAAKADNPLELFELDAAAVKNRLQDLTEGVQ